MKRLIITAGLGALMLTPAGALAKRHHHHNRGHRVHRVAGTVGTIKSFDSSTGDLVITTAKGREISALVTDATHIQCDAADATTTDTRTTRHGDEGSGDDNQGDDDQNGDDENGGDDQGDDHGHQNGRCTTAALVAGTPVNRARIDLNGGDDAVWTKLVLGSTTTSS
jgi:hypothetical protein